MAASWRWSSLSLICLLYCSNAMAQANNTNTTGTIVTNAVQLSNETAFAACLYPSSGAYSFLNRLLYYCTLIFALLSRAHLWLVVGALAAALTYSGTAAVHACLLAWRGPNPFEESDIWPLITILSTACLITVPLLSWSSTLRRLGARFADTKDKNPLHTQRHDGTRTIVIYWAFLVLVGYICAWVAVQWTYEDAVSYPDMSQVFCRPGTNASVFHSSDGTFHLRAIDQAFVTENKCNNPCDLLTIPSIFRRNDDLVLLDYRKALLYSESLKGEKYKRVNALVEGQDIFINIQLLLLPFILLQGFVSVCFGRRDPREIRDLIYIKMALAHPWSDKNALLAIQDGIARVVAALSYVLAVLMVIICPPLFVLTIIAQEWSTRYQIPDAEPMTNIGQWGPWAVAVQAILAALIARYHDTVVGFVSQVCRGVWNKCRGHRKQPAHQDAHEKTPQSQSGISGSDIEAAQKTTTEVKTNVLPPPTQASSTKPKQPWYRRLNAFVVGMYRSAASPLNQNGDGLWDEIKNFFHWCRDPRQVSRMVVRHPIRVREEQLVEKDDDTNVTQNGSVNNGQVRRGSGFFGAAKTRNPGENVSQNKA